MAKKNDDFFVRKKEWSKVKDELLGCYLKPYLQKVLHTNRKIIYVDCFAGKGLFDDGEKGSPLIALDTMRECLEQTKVAQGNINPYFIDLNYADDLKKNLIRYPQAKIISGKYEDNIEFLLCDKQNCNVFLYIDPYGIKALDCPTFDRFSHQGFNSIELLINLNSFGFIREACRVLGTEFKETDILTDLIEYDTTKLSTDEKSKNALNCIAGGDYWIQIINDYRTGKFNVYEAEKRFVNSYCNRLRKSFEYVLNMPLRVKKGQVPKYRMIHITNHPDGCLIMADNIQGRWEYMNQIQNAGQLSLFEESSNDEDLDNPEIKEQIIKHISNVSTMTSLNKIIADFYTKYGPICKTGHVKDVYRELEKAGLIEVFRDPAFTLTGRPSSFFADEKGKYTELRWKH